MHKQGFTLIELMISMVILSIISLLGFIVIRSSYESQSLIEAQGLVNANLRGVMAGLTSELELAYTEPRLQSVQQPAGVEPVAVSNEGRTVTFFRPVADSSPRGYAWRGPITFSLQNEDTPEGTQGEGNALLDPGEDENEDGVLNRRILRTEGAEERTIGGANNISDLQFQLIQNPDPNDNRFTSLQIRLTASVAYGPSNQIVRNSLESRVRFMNAGAAE